MSGDWAWTRTVKLNEEWASVDFGKEQGERQRQGVQLTPGENY